MRPEFHEEKKDMMQRQSTRNENTNCDTGGRRVGQQKSLARGNFQGPSKRLGGICLILAMVMFCGVSRARGQIINNFEFSGGFAYSTGDGGLGGLTVGTSLWVHPRVSLGLDYDSVYDNSSIGTFELTSIGHTAVKSHLQNFLVGPRVFFSAKRIKKYHFNPFAEVKIGDSLLSQSLRSVNVGSASGSAHSFSWMLGGGADYAFNRHWSGRLNLDLLRTHLADVGQSRLRIGVGVAYTIAGRGTK
jgi:opacity protein-like surface antigen